VKLDKLDIRILVALQNDGRLTKTKLAEMIHLSPTACWERLKRLENAQIISSYHAKINLEKFIHQTTIMVEITLKRHQLKDFKKFENAIHQIPEVIECLATGGGVDYIMKVMIPDIDYYQKVIDRMLIDDIGIDKYFTYIVTKPVKSVPGLPVELLLQKQQASPRLHASSDE